MNKPNTSLGKCLLFLALFTISFQLQAQDTKVFVITGGIFGALNNLVRVGFYNPIQGNYIVIDSIAGDFTDNPLLDGNELYVNASDRILKYNVSFPSRTAISPVIPGAEGMAIYQDQLLVSSDFGVKKDRYLTYLQKNSLTVLDSLNTLFGESGPIVISGDTAYISVPYGFGNNSSDLASVNLKTNTLITHTNVPGDLVKMLGYKNSIFAIATAPGVPAALIELNRTTQSAKFVKFGVSTALLDIEGDTLSALSPSGKLYRYLLPGRTLIDSTSYDIAPSRNGKTDFIAAAEFDSKNRMLWYTSTDFATQGRLYGIRGNVIRHNIDVGASPEGLAVYDIRVSAVNEGANNDKNNVSIYPNPANGYVNILGLLPGTTYQVAVLSITGATISTTNMVGSPTLDIHGLTPGTYLIKVASKGTVPAVLPLVVQ